MGEDIKINDIIGPYQVIKKLPQEHQGGMATVCVVQTRSKHRVANQPQQFVMKIAKPEAINFLKREADYILGTLNHPHIVRVFPDPIYLQRHGKTIYQTFDDFNGLRLPLFVMEYVPGGALVNKIKQVTLPHILIIAQQIASALNYIHQKNIIHLDVKPHNILFRQPYHWWNGSKLQVVLCDFGTAHGGNLPPPHDKAATPDYMSPEQFQSHASLTPQSDIYSFGAVLYELITKRTPLANPYVELLDLNHQPSLPNSGSATLDAVVMRCLQKQPYRRYRDGVELEQALMGIHDLPLDWRPVVNYGVIGLATVGLLACAGQLAPSVLTLFDSTPTPTHTATMQPTFTPTMATIMTPTPGSQNLATVIVSTATLTPTIPITPTAAVTSFATSTPLPTLTPSPIPPTSTPTPIPTAVITNTQAVTSTETK